MQRGSKIRRNGDLRGLPEVRVIGSSGEALGVMALAEALRLAFKEGLDLVEVNPKVRPPVCKLLNFDRYKYAEMKARALKRREDGEVASTFVMLHRWGKVEKSTDPGVLGSLLVELDAPDQDDEHVSVSVRLSDGWCVGAYVSGLVVFENVEELTTEPRCLRVRTREEARKLMELLVTGNLVALEEQPWQPGNG
jgi:hypothetical protein